MFFAQTYNTDSEDLQDAVYESTGGGTFIVKDGSYKDFESTFEIIATKDKPVIIMAESVGGVTLTGESHFVLKKSAFVTIQGFVFDGKVEIIGLDGKVVLSHKIENKKQNLAIDTSKL